MEVKIPAAAVVCAARHFIAAHKSACTNSPVDFGDVCAECGEWNHCKADWTKTAAPLFDAADLWPDLLRPFPE